VSIRSIGVWRCPCSSVLISLIGVSGPANCQADDALASLPPLEAPKILLNGTHSAATMEGGVGGKGHGRKSATDDARP
jgi:hypothetical protein